MGIYRLEVKKIHLLAKMNKTASKKFYPYKIYKKLFFNSLKLPGSKELATRCDWPSESVVSPL